MQALVLVTFVGVLAIFGGTYWLLVLRQESQAATQIRRRLKTSVRSTARKLGLARERQALSTVAPLNVLLGRADAVVAPLQRLFEQADTRWSIGRFLLMSGTAAVAGYLVVAGLTGFRGIGVLAGVLLAAGPAAYLNAKRSRRMLKFEEKFPEAIELIARALRAGHAFTTGLSMAAEEIPDPVGAEFRLLYDRQNFGMPLPEALRAFADRVPLLDARFFATAVLTQREAGGNLSEVLDNLARVVRERFKVKRQIRIVSAHARMTGWVLVALPPVTAVAFMMIVPDTMKLLVQDPMGVKMVVVAIVLQITGGLMVKKLVNIEY